MSEYLYLSPELIVPKRQIAALVKQQITGNLGLIFIDGTRVGMPEHKDIDEAYQAEFQGVLVKINKNGYVNPLLATTIAKKALEEVRVYFKAICYISSEANLENTLKILSGEITLDQLQGKNK